MDCGLIIHWDDIVGLVFAKIAIQEACLASAQARYIYGAEKTFQRDSSVEATGNRKDPDSILKISTSGLEFEHERLTNNWILEETLWKWTAKYQDLIPLSYFL